MAGANFGAKGRDRPAASAAGDAAKGKRLGILDVRTVASLFLFIFTVRLVFAVVNNLISEWCREMDFAVTRGIEFPGQSPNTRIVRTTAAAPSAFAVHRQGASE